jgi:hypothetical protein
VQFLLGTIQLGDDSTTNLFPTKAEHGPDKPNEQQ